MNSKKNLVLLVVFAGMLLYAVKGELPKDDAKLSDGIRLNDMSRQGIEKLHVKNAKGEFTFVNPNPIVIANDSELGFDTGAWTLEGIKDSRLDPAGVSRIVSNLKEMRFSNPIPPAELESDLSIYGLAQPEIVVSVEGKDKSGKESSFGVEVGGLNKYVEKRYARIVGEPSVYLVNDAIFGAANRGRDDYRLKTPITFSDADVTKFEFSRPGEQLEFSRDNNTWRIEKPIKATGGAFSIPEILKGFRNLSVKTYVDDPAEVAKLGLDKANYILKVARKGLPDVVVRLGERKTPQSQVEGVFQIEGQTVAYVANSGVPPELQMALTQMREKRLFSFGWERAVKAGFEMPNDKFELVKSGEEWKLGDKDADAVFVKELLRQWGTLEASDYPAANEPKTKFGFDKPTAKLTVKLDGDESEQVFVIGKSFSMTPKAKGQPKGVKYYAARNDLSEPFIIDKESAERLFPKKEALLKTPAPAGEAAAKE